MQTNNKLILTRDISSSTSVLLDKSTRQIAGTFSSEYPVTRYGFLSNLEVDDPSLLPDDYYPIEFEEILSHDSSHWDTQRVKNGVCCLLNEHYRANRLGKIVDVTLDGKIGQFKAILNTSQDSELLAKEIEDGIAPGISFGYIVNKYEVVNKNPLTLKAVDIELIEISVTSVPADPTVGLSKSAINLSLRSINNLDISNGGKKMSDRKVETSIDVDIEKQVNQRVAAIEDKYKNTEKSIFAFLKCRDLAQRLLSEAKISASEYEETFSDDIEKDIKSMLERGLEFATSEINSILFWLEKADKRSPALPISQATSDVNLPLPKDDSERLRRFSESFSKNHKRVL